MNLNTELKVALELALHEAAIRNHEFAGLEHLLLALCHESDVLNVLKNLGANVDDLKQVLRGFLEEEMEPLPDDTQVQPRPTLAFHRVLQLADFHVRNSGKSEVKGSNVLVALFSQQDCHAVSFLQNEGVRRLDVVSFISHGADGADRRPAYEMEGAEEEAEGDSGSKDALQQFCTDMTEQARQGVFDPTVGRKKELDRAIQILARRRKNNPLFVGDSGVGKTALVEGLAQRVATGNVPSALSKVSIFSLDLGGLLAGTRYRGDFEKRVKAVLSALDDREEAVLFIDEIHTLIGAGSASGAAMDAANLLKPALERGLRCIGATTHKEYRSYLERDHALVRRFQVIQVLEPTLVETKKILKGLKSHYEDFHGVRFTKGAIAAAAELSHRYMSERRLPDKAIDVLDEAAAAVKLAGKGVRVGTAQVRAVVGSMARIPVQNMNQDERSQLKELEPSLKTKVFGQDDAIEALTASIKMSRAGLRAPNKPIGSYLFTGPTGVGKTEVARQLALTMGVALIRFDMSEYMERHTVSRLIGAPPGYVGFDQGGLLTEAVIQSPHAVVLLDEIEKAHPDVFNLLLQVMDHGALTDNNGRSADFRHVVLIMTSNVGAREIQKRKLGFGGEMNFGADETAFQKWFSPEFRNRLDARIPFQSLSPKVMANIVDKFIAELCDQLRPKKVSLKLTPSAREHLVEQGFDPANGARPLARLIEREIKVPLGDHLLFGALAQGGQATVRVQKGALLVEVTPR